MTDMKHGVTIPSGPESVRNDIIEQAGNRLAKMRDEAIIDAVRRKTGVSDPRFTFMFDNMRRIQSPYGLDQYFWKGDLIIEFYDNTCDGFLKDGVYTVGRDFRVFV